MSETKVNTAPVKWAQRADSIYLTLDLPDVKDEQLKLTKDMLSFRQVSGPLREQPADISLYTEFSVDYGCTPLLETTAGQPDPRRRTAHLTLPDTVRYRRMIFSLCH